MQHSCAHSYKSLMKPHLVPISSLAFTVDHSECCVKHRKAWKSLSTLWWWSSSWKKAYLRIKFTKGMSKIHLHTPQPRNGLPSQSGKGKALKMTRTKGAQRVQQLLNWPCAHNGFGREKSEIVRAKLRRSLASQLNMLVTFCIMNYT